VLVVSTGFMGSVMGSTSVVFAQLICKKSKLKENNRVVNFEILCMISLFTKYKD
jgi:hypothetical protein